MSSRITTVILDFGGVLGLPQDPARVTAMAAICRLPRERFMEEYRPDRLELDRGTLSTDAYWSRILSVGGVAPTRENLDRLEREDALSWTRVNVAMISWARELRGAGFRTAILSNMPREKLAFFRSSGDFSWLGEFEAAIFSCDYEMVKPEKEFYALCLSRLGVKPGECLFLDDVAANTEAASACGINTLLFHTAPEAAAEIERLWGLPVKSLRDGAPV
jgi:putative hydrolase of the HAD superfamily